MCRILKSGAVLRQWTREAGPERESKLASIISSQTEHRQKWGVQMGSDCPLWFTKIVTQPANKIAPGGLPIHSLLAAGFWLSIPKHSQ